MKKFLLLLACSVSFFTVHAQKFDFGAKVGISSTSLVSNNFSDLNSFKSMQNYNGALLGLYSQIGIAGFYIQPEMYIRNNNFKINYDSLGTSLGSVENKLYYIDVPVLFAKRFLKVIMVKGGPSFQFLLNADGNVTNPASNQPVKLDKGSFNNLLVGFQAGVSVDISRISIDLRYDLSVNNIGAVAKSYTSSLNNVDFSSRASVFMVSVGYKFIKI